MKILEILKEIVYDKYRACNWRKQWATTGEHADYLSRPPGHLKHAAGYPGVF